MKETRGIIILLFYTENATLKQTLNGACPTAQRLASSVRELTNFIIKANILISLIPNQQSLLSWYQMMSQTPPLISSNHRTR